LGFKLTPGLGSHLHTTVHGNSEFIAAKDAINRAIQNYSESTGYLTMIMGGTLLAEHKSEKRQNILDWLWKGDHWERHEDLVKTRVQDTGKWFLKSPEFKNWVTGDESLSLICHGIRTDIPC
jgi:hypothetical protein